METKVRPIYPDADRATVFEEGLEFQDFVADLLAKELGITLTSYSSKRYQTDKGENRQGFEIKLDKRLSDTGNVSIEVAEKSTAQQSRWTPSGIMRNDNSWIYVQGNMDIVFVFGKKVLVEGFKNKYADKVWEPKSTIRTFLMPVPVARLWALKVFELTPKGAAL